MNKQKMSIDKFFNSRKQFNNAIKKGTKKISLDLEDKQDDRDAK